MKSLGDLSVSYRPWSDERRQAARERALLRIHGTLENAPPKRPTTTDRVRKLLGRHQTETAPTDRQFFFHRNEPSKAELRAMLAEAMRNSEAKKKVEREEVHPLDRLMDFLGYRPIEEAPTDGTEIMVWGEGRGYKRVRYDESEGNQYPWKEGNRLWRWDIFDWWIEVTENKRTPT